MGREPGLLRCPEQGPRCPTVLWAWVQSTGKGPERITWHPSPPLSEDSALGLEREGTSLCTWWLLWALGGSLACALGLCTGGRKPQRHGESSWMAAAAQHCPR